MSVFTRFMQRLFTPTSEIARDVDDELNHHLDVATERYELQGLSPLRARRAALDEMGDFDATRRRCIRDATAPVRMVRLAVALFAVSALGMSAYGYRSARDDLREARAAVSDMRDEVDTLRSGLAAVRGGEIAALAQTVNFITIEGAVQHPRLWTLPRNTEPTLRQLIQRSGGLAGNATGEIVVTRLRGREVLEVVTINPDEWADPTGPDPVLEGFFHVVATEETRTALNSAI